MNIKLCFFITLLLLSQIANQILAQTSLSKEEILKLWKEKDIDYPKDIEDAINVFAHFKYGKEVRYKILFTIDSLRMQGIRKICAKSTTLSGWVTAPDSCFDNSYAWSITHIYWKLDNDFYSMTIKGNCNTQAIKVDAINLFEHFDKFHEVISQEYYMPVIYSGVKLRENKYSFSTSSKSHDPVQDVLIISDNNFAHLWFENFWIEDKKSLFYEYNLALKSHLLFQLLEKSF